MKTSKKPSLLDYLYEVNALANQISQFSGQVSRLVVGDHQLSDVFEKITQLTNEFFKADRTVIFRLITPDRVKMVAAFDSKEPAISEVGKTFDLTKHRLNCEVIRKRKPAIEEDIADSKRMSEGMKMPLKKLGIKSFLTLPLVAEDNCLGLLCIDYRRKHRFSDQEIKLAEIVADEVAETILAVQKNNLLRQYSKWFLGEELLKKSLTQGEIIKPEWRYLYLLFADIRGFTQFTIDNPVDRIIKVTSGFFRLVNEIVYPRQGRLNETKGDEAFVFFDDLDNCLEAALEMSNKGGRFLKRYQLSCGIGIHCGKVLVGLFGAADTRHYRVIGAPINIAKALQRKAKDNHIFVSQLIYKKGKGKYNFQPIANLKTKLGKTKAYQLKARVV